MLRLSWIENHTSEKFIVYFEAENHHKDTSCNKPFISKECHCELYINVPVCKSTFIDYKWT